MSFTPEILRNVYAKEEYEGRRGDIARRLRRINRDINVRVWRTREEKWKRRLFCVMDLSNYDIEDTQGTLIFVVTESMCDDAQKGIWSEEIRTLGRDTYIALGNSLLARSFDV